MTLIVHVWVSCSKPLKHRTSGRAPDLSKVPGQWCQLFPALDNYDLLVSESTIKWNGTESDLGPQERLARACSDCQRQMQAAGHTGRGLTESIAAWWISLQRAAWRALAERNRGHVNGCEKEPNGLLLFPKRPSLPGCRLCCCLEKLPETYFLTKIPSRATNHLSETKNNK